MAPALAITWSLDALADLDRFAAFLHERFPDLAPRIADELIERTELLRRHPTLGRRIGERDEYRELLVQALGATYALQYRHVAIPSSSCVCFTVEKHDRGGLA